MINFGKINNGFSDILVESIKQNDSNKKLTFQKYLKELKENKILRNQYFIYDNITNKTETNDLKVSEYIKENIALMGNYSLRDIKRENEKLQSLLGENIANDYVLNELHENINILITTKKTPETLNKITEAFSFISDYIKKNKIVKEEKVSVEESVSKFNERYSNLTESEQRILKVAMGSDDEEKKSVFSEVIRECIDLINNNLVECELETKEKLLNVKDRLLRMSYINENFINDMGKIFELKKGLDNKIED